MFAQRLSDSRSTMFSVTPTAFLAGTLLVVALFVIPAVASGFWLTAFTLSVCYTIGLAGLSLVYARLGQVSLVQASLIAVGGWVTLRLSHLGVPFEICVLGGAVATGAVGFLIGLPALRMRGLYLALVTLMAAGGAQILFNRIRFPNGGEGFLGAVRSGGVPMDRSILAVSDPAYFRYTVIVCVLAFVIIELHRRGRPGRAWALIRKSEAAAVASGVNVTLYKTWAFTLSGVLAGLAGGMLAGTLGVLDPINFKPSESILLFALAVVGGVYSWIGPVIAGILYKIVPSLLNSWGIDGDIAGIIFGAALLHALITAPRGLGGQLEDLLQRISGGRRHD